MAMYQKILVPLDGSKRAEAIMPHVEDLAQCYQAQVVLLQVIEPRPLLIDGTYAVPDLVEHEQHLKTAESYLLALQGKLRQKGIEVKTHIAQGPVVTEIINAAERENADLIALASHGRTGLARVFYGSVAAGILHRVDRPLLLVRSEGND
ncbi:MAG: universal stress protein [Anaerolineales bacterium]|nr:universal stress protein [Anaerolineales bacterium]